MQYLDSKIIGFINFFYDEVKKQKMPWRVNVSLYNHHIPTTLCPYSYDGVIIEIIHTDIDLRYKNASQENKLLYQNLLLNILQNVYSRKLERSLIIGS